MTVSAQVPIDRSTGNGVTVSFPYNFLLLDEDDLTVYLDDAEADPSTYTISGIGTVSGGNVTFTVAPAAGVIVSRVREMLLSRLVDYQDAGDFLADTVDADFDRIWMALQDSNARFGRSLHVGLGDASTYDDLEIPSIAARSNLFLGFDASGRPVALSGTGGDTDLRIDLAGAGGADLVGYEDVTVGDALDALRSPVIVIFSTGQSNMPQAIAYDWSPPSNLFLWNFDGNSQASSVVGTAFIPASASSVGPSVAAGAVLARENPGASVYVINVYRGGLGLVNWGPSPVDYNFRQAITGNVAAALAALNVSKIDYFVWAGCESDANAQSQTIVFDMETWLWGWLKTLAWFEPYTPSFVLGMSPYAQSSPGNLDYLWRRYNGALKGSCGIFPSWRQYIDFDEFPDTLYDPTGSIPYIHRTAEGYYKAGEKLGRCMLTGITEPITRSDNAGGQWTPTFDPAQFVNCTDVTLAHAKWWRPAGTNTIEWEARAAVTVTAANVDTTFWMTVPVKAKAFPNLVAGQVTSAQRDSGIILPVASQQAVQIFFNARLTGVATMIFRGSYTVNHSDILPNSPPGTT